ncbi:Uma2 family endonuclease [Lamprocystis purpurea]|uniref:Uma2 family endonuclease n=1 Tax=Lamprocystis purpurea TaxID=61598 RepID=UPI00035DDD82|nr:Uma2 family endonuclease [Lamprocystis purpurea]
MSSIAAPQPAPASQVPAPPPRRLPAADPTPRSADGLLVSEAIYWTTYYLESDHHYEWNNGRLEEKPVSDYETFLVYAWFGELVRHFLRTHPCAQLVGLEMGFRLPLPGGTVIRKPDFGVVRNDNPQPLLPLACSYHGVFDLCIEALSDQERSGIERDTVIKKAEYAAGGVPEYYILHQNPAHQAFYTRTPAGFYTPIAPQAGVICSRVLPGLQFRPTDLARRPDLETLRDDPVYAGFVLPGWRADRERAEAEAQAKREAVNRANAEARRADAEAQRAETEAQAKREAVDRAEAEAQRAEAEAQRAVEQTRRADAEAQARQRLEHELAALRERLAQG